MFNLRIIDNVIIQSEFVLQSIQTERLQGQSIQCSVDEGNITTTSVYSTSSVFTCNHGNINLMNVHGASKTSVIQGNLVLGTIYKHVVTCMSPILIGAVVVVITW